MDFKYFGLIDIVLVVSFLIVVFIGWKKGFVQKFLSLANSICGLLFSLIFCRDFANILIGKNIIYGNIYDKVYSNVIENELLQNSNATEVEILQSLGLPASICEFLAGKIEIDSGSIAASISQNISTWVMIILSFFMLFFGTTILCAILKVVFKAFREASILIKVTDGLLGIVFYAIIYIIVLDVLLLVLSVCMQTVLPESVLNFIEIDMKLSSDEFRISKYLYNNNLIGNLIGLFI